VYLCRYFNLPEVANYWEQVIIPNAPKNTVLQKKIISLLFITVRQENCFLGWALKGYHRYLRESAAIYVADLI
jgi:UDPglucose 6-dehydrogenase